METEFLFRQLLGTADFGARARDAIFEFRCKNWNNLASLPDNKLDCSISNLHKALANHTVAARRLRLNARKRILLHAIRLRVLDRARCNTPLLA